MMLLRWFSSGRNRQALAMCKHVRKLLNHQRDILSPKAIGEVEAAIAGVRSAVAEGADTETLDRKCKELEESATGWIKPYPNAAWRENIEVLLVALAVAMGIRTFFLQPFKIPTGSMQPTLYGVTPSENSTPWDREDLRNQPPPNRFARLVDYWFNGVQRNPRSFALGAGEARGRAELLRGSQAPARHRTRAGRLSRAALPGLNASAMRGAELRPRSCLDT
jgi:signal peptidase I